jgi:hypothetical protein
MEVASHGRRPAGRGKATLALDWWPSALPRGATIEPHTLVAQDGEVSRGWLYSRGASDLVFCLMHPRQEMHRHPLIPYLVEAGAAVWAQSGRDVGNDLRLIHESALLDVAAGMEILREKGFDRIVLVGISGGAGLYSFYTEQALSTPSTRISKTPGGAPTPLPDANLLPPDALALIAPHPGQGRLLLSMIDPSVTDESDPLSVSPALDPYNPVNGYGEAPGGSVFTQEFLKAYREAQHRRVEAIDARARELIAERMEARKRWKSGSEEVRDLRASVATPILATYRTDADPRCTDLRLDPSDRPYGSVISPRPAVSNYGPTGFGRLTTPEAWLSTWSGLSSNVSLVRAVGGIPLPTLVVEYSGDCSVFPSDVKAILAATASQSLRHKSISADHFGRALQPEAPSGIPLTASELLEWAGGSR